MLCCAVRKSRSGENIFDVAEIGTSESAAPVPSKPFANKSAFRRWVLPHAPPSVVGQEQPNGFAHSVNGYGHSSKEFKPARERMLSEPQSSDGGTTTTDTTVMTSPSLGSPTTDDVKVEAIFPEGEPNNMTLSVY